MELGAFPVSLTVRDLDLSRAFSEKLRFERRGGDGEHYLIMVNGSTIVGLYQGMFERNILTFNPGLTQDKEQLAAFTDVRDIRARLLASGLELQDDTDPDGTGPAHSTLVDPDGNPILIDQFFPKPGPGA